MINKYIHTVFRNIFILIGGLFFCISFSPKPLFAQFYNGSQLTFGKNRVQYQKQNWEYYRTPQFDVYFYPTGKELAQYTLNIAPSMIAEIEKMLNFNTTKKIQFIVYNTQSDFRESNFAYDNDDFYNKGGVTNIYGTKIYLYFDGNRAHFDQMLRAGIMNLYAHWIINGTSVGANIATESLLDVPNWFFSGLSSYIAENWNSTLDAHIKNGILTQNYTRLDELNPVDATYAGHSLWKYIADRFGESAIPSILYATSAARGYERGIYNVTGVPFKQLVIDWFRYYYVIYKKDNHRDKPEGKGILKKPKPSRIYQQMRLSPDGTSFAYVTNENGKIIVWLQTPNTTKPKRIFCRYQKTEDNPDLTFPLLAWHPNGELLGITLEYAGRCYYYPYHVDTKKMDKRLLVDVEKITDISFSPDGKMLVFSGFQHGQSDIFLYSLMARTFQNVTQDFYDDYAPRCLSDNQHIIFSSNRPDNLLHPKEHFQQLQPQKNYDLFMMNYKEKNAELMQITATPDANETNTRILDDQSIIYTSNSNGIYNRYIAHFDSVISTIDTAIHYSYVAHNTAISDGSYSLLEQDYCKEDHTVAEIILYKGAHRIYIHPLNTEPINHTLTNCAFLQQLQKVQAYKDSVRAAEIQRYGNNFGQHRQFRQVRRNNLNTLSQQMWQSANEYKNDTDSSTNYQYAARNYYTQFSVNKLVTQADFSFLNHSYQQFTGGESPIYLNTGVNAFVMVGLTDLFEDYRITGGFRLGFNLQSNEFMLSYEDLHKRLDHQIVVYRQSIKSSNNNYYYKEHSTSLFYIMKYPFNKLNSIRLTLTGRYDVLVYGGVDVRSLMKKDEKHLWGGIKAEYIFDSSKELYTNLWRGSKIKIFAEYQHRIDKDNKHLFVIGIDARKSIKIYRNMTWAIRIAGSTNWGSSRLIYYMGGVDNWIAARFNNDLSIDQSKEFAYQTLATNMRGFKQNIRNGTSFIVLNSEFRIPFVQLIAGRYLANVFLNSLQFNIFGDIGTAWTGLTPYAEDNNLYTRYITAGSITAKIKRHVDPFVGGFGVGLRANLFGYLLRFDYAWGIEDFKIANKKGQFYFSIGMDF